MTIASGKPGFTTLFGQGTVLVGDAAVLVPRLAIATVQVDARMAIALAGHFKNPLLKNTQQLFMTVGDDANPGGAPTPRVQERGPGPLTGAEKKQYDAGYDAIFGNKSTAPNSIPNYPNAARPGWLEP